MATMKIKIKARVKNFGEASQSRFGRGIAGEVGARLRSTASSHENDLPLTPSHHTRQNGAYRVQSADKINLEDIFPLFRTDRVERANRTLYASVGNQNIQRGVEMRVHAFDGSTKAFEITNVRENAVGSAAAVFDFKFGDADFASRAAQ